MTVAIPNDTTTQLIAEDVSKTPAKALWIQNLSLTVGFWLTPQVGDTSAADSVTVGADLFLAPAQDIASVTVPTTFLTDNPALVQARWLARQDSGGSVDLNVGRI